MKNKIISIILLLPLLALTLAGCRNSEYSESEITGFVQKEFGYAELASAGNQKSFDNSTSTLYTYRTEQGFLFEVDSYYVASGGVFGLPSAHLNNNYFEAMNDYLEQDINRLKRKYNAKINQDAESIDLELSSFLDIDKKINFVFDYYALVKDCLPDASKDTPLFSGSSGKMTVTLYSGDNKVLKICFDEKFSEMTSDYVKECARISYAHIYRDYQNGKDDFSSIPELYINRLYINGEEFTSEEYESEFVYDAASGEYCIPVGYGLHLEYNGGVDDYMQREIVTDYLGGSYRVDSKTRTTEYTVGGNKYKVIMKKDEPESARFYINGKKQDIKLLGNELDFWGSTGATYFYYMKLSDYAEMLGMDYRVDQSECAVYLTSRN